MPWGLARPLDGAPPSTHGVVLGDAAILGVCARFTWSAASTTSPRPGAAKPGAIVFSIEGATLPVGRERAASAG